MYRFGPRMWIFAPILEMDGGSGWPQPPVSPGGCAVGAGAGVGPGAGVGVGFGFGAGGGVGVGRTGIDTFRTPEVGAVEALGG